MHTHNMYVHTYVYYIYILYAYHVFTYVCVVVVVEWRVHALQDAVTMTGSGCTTTSFLYTASSQHEFIMTVHVFITPRMNRASYLC